VNEHLEKILTEYEGRPKEVIPLLQEVQAALGHLPREAMLAIARFTGVPESRVYGVASFYGQFPFRPLGKRHIRVCRGISCHVRGASRILQAMERHLGIREGETTPDLEYSLDTVACLGTCGLAPCVAAGEKVEARMTPEKVAEYLAKDRRR